MAYLEITLKVAERDRKSAAEVYTKYRDPFLKQVAGAKSKELLIRDEDVQVLHRFDTVDNAKSYLTSNLFTQDVAGTLKPLLQSPPEIRIYESAESQGAGSCRA
jgi:hypothetical protein